jgi:hypothetical protein
MAQRGVRDAQPAEVDEERLGQVVVCADGSHEIRPEGTEPGEVTVGEIIAEGRCGERFVARPSRPLPQIDGGVTHVFESTEEAAEHLVDCYRRARRSGLWRG